MLAGEARQLPALVRRPLLYPISAVGRSRRLASDHPPSLDFRSRPGRILHGDTVQHHPRKITGAAPRVLAEPNRTSSRLVSNGPSNVPLRSVLPKNLVTRKMVSPKTRPSTWG